MQRTLTITKQWQIYIPEEIRTLLKLQPTDRLKALVKGKSLTLVKEESPIMKLAGSVKTPPGLKVDLDNIRDYIDYTGDDTP